MAIAFPRLTQRRRTLAIALIAIIATSALMLLSEHHGLTTDGATIFRLSFFKSDPCEDWDPAREAVHDPPECLRAAQYRQVQAFLADPQWDYEEKLMNDVRRLENCTLGIIDCPPRPVIVSVWWFVYTGRKGAIAGEEVWMKEVVELIVNEGFIVLDHFRMARMLHLTRALSLSIHMVWMNENMAVECASNPRCILPEHYRPPTDARYRHDLSAIPPDELGAIPIWRLFCTTWWGSRPSNADRIGGQMNRDWGIPETGGNEVWSFQPLGRRWQISPYPYPGHTWVPISMESECKRTPLPDTRNDSILVMNKLAARLYDMFGRKVDFDAVQAQLEAEGITAKFVSTVRFEKGETEAMLPNALHNLGAQTKEQYNELVSNVKVMMGIGGPSISPSPYLALCRGTPVVLPYLNAAMPKPEGWETYSIMRFQHGPLSALSEPYVYNYFIGDNEGLAKQLAKAMNTPINPYVPKGYATADVVKGVRKMLYFDYYREYHQIWKANGKKTPCVPEYMLDKCWERNTCYHGKHEDEYIAD